MNTIRFKASKHTSGRFGIFDTVCREWTIWGLTKAKAQALASEWNQEPIKRRNAFVLILGGAA